MLRRFSPAAVTRLAALLIAALGIAQPACVRVECQLNSDCPERSSCIMNQCISRCGGDRDCPTGQSCNINGMCVGANPVDSGVDAPADAFDARPDGQPDVVAPIDNTPPTDTPTPVDNVVPPTDTPMPVDVPIATDVPMDIPMDVPTTGTRRYLDSCARDGDCASGICTATAPRFCTRTCSVPSDCADGQICAAGRCALDDVGVRGCNTTTGAPCLQFCIGNATTSHCTRDCTSVSDCPSGYACAPVGTRHVCVQIEIPCTTADQCPSSLGFCGAGMVGCTSNCTTAADCPRRLTGLPPYTCEARSGQMVCVPPFDVAGSDPLFASCPATGTVYCRSGVCADLACNQACTPRGGCGPNAGCYPQVEGADVYLLCHAAGRAWVNESCGASSDCYTGLCDTSNYCSKLCNDGLCPSGMTCVDTGLNAVDGTRLRLCRR